MRQILFSVIFALLSGGVIASAQAQSASSAQDEALPMCRDARAGERCQTRNGDIRMRPERRGDGPVDGGREVPLESLTATQLERLTTEMGIGGRWECSCSDGEGKCNPVVENGSLECFAPGTGGCTGTCGLGVTVDTTGIGAGQTQGPGG
jgi:hypothetical protein